LKKSVGKNYISDTLCVMNSEIRKIVNGRWEYQGYINQALLKGTISKGPDAGQKSKISFYEVGPNLEAALRGVKGPIRERLVEIGISEHKPILDLAPKQMSWWTPQELGGLGIPNESAEASVRARPFELEARIIAAYCISSPKIWGSRPVPKTTKGVLSTALAQARKMIPRVVVHRKTPKMELEKYGWNDNELVLPGRKHAQLGGREMMQFLLGMPLRLDYGTTPYADLELAFHGSEGHADNRRLAEQWKRWVKPALNVCTAFKDELLHYEQQRLTSGFGDLYPLANAPPELVMQPLRFDRAHVEYETNSLVGLDRMSSPSRYDRSDYCDLGRIHRHGGDVLKALPRLSEEV
jgi:hypothetical protein